ncbi:MAG: hypothetical protein WB626_10275 [Bacteroidota bacterium]
MTRVERLRTLSFAACCACDHPLNVLELEEFYGAADEELHGEPYCPDCLPRSLALCPECSGRRTSGGLCSACAARDYALAG